MFHMKSIRVLLFGPEAAAAGVSAIDVQISEATCKDVLKAIADQHPALRGSLGSARIAVNREFAAGHRRLLRGTRLPLIGLVSGG